MWIYYRTFALSVSLTDHRENPQESGRQNDSNNVVMYSDSSNGGEGDLVILSVAD